MTDTGPDPHAMACAVAALPHWGLAHGHLQFASARENVVYRLDAAGAGSFALRIHRPGYHSIAELESEHQWTTALSAYGIATPRPVPTLAGAAYAMLPYGDAGEQRVVGLIEWIDGTPMQDAIRQPGVDHVELMRDIGRLIAQMHNHAEQWHPGPGFVRPHLDADGLLGRNPVWHPFWALPELTSEESELIIAVRDRLYRSLRELSQRAQVYSVIHADVLPQNIIIRDGRPFVFDFDDCAFGWHVHDLAIALLPFQSHRSFGDLVRATISGYRQMRPVAESDLQRLPMFLLVRQLSILGWMNQKVKHSLHLAPGQVASRAELLKPRIAAALAGCRALMAGANPYPSIVIEC